MTIWTLLIRSSWAVLIALAIIATASVFLPKVKQYHELQRRETALQEEIRQAEDRLVTLKRKQERLQNDPRYAEKIAREEFGLVKPGETVLHFIEDEQDDSYEP
jgi:cell division protein FtsB